MLEDTRYLTSNQVAARYQIQRRSLARWLANKAMGFPTPMQLNRKLYFRVTDLDEFDRRTLMATLSKREAA